MHFCRQSRLSILATPTTTHHHQHQLNRLELGVSFSSGLPGWFLSCFFVAFIKEFVKEFGLPTEAVGVGCHFRPAVWGPAGVWSLFRISVSTHKFH